jgi:hypothetical protein
MNAFSMLRLQSLIDRLVALEQDRQPGLHTWCACRKEVLLSMRDEMNRLADGALPQLYARTLGLVEELEAAHEVLRRLPPEDLMRIATRCQEARRALKLSEEAAFQAMAPGAVRELKEADHGA